MVLLILLIGDYMIFGNTSLHNIFGLHIFGITDVKSNIHEMNFSVYIPFSSFFSKDAMVGKLNRGWV